MPRRFFTLFAWLVALVMASPALSQPAPPDWRAVAARAHSAGEYGERDAALRSLAQARRLADTHAAPDWTPAESLNLTAEVIDQLSRRAGVGPAALFASGVDELGRAADCPAFVAAHFNGDRVAIRGVLSSWAVRKPATAAEARVAALELTRELRARCGLRRPAAVALELVAGACAAVDAYTHFDSAPAGAAASGGGVDIVSRRPDHFEIRLSHFADATPTELDAALRVAVEVGAEGVALDLRGNAGGSLDAARGVCGRFIRGEVGRTRFGELVATGSRVWAGPLTLRVDGGTASAAELVAAALQERGRAVVIGEPTFGKGRVQAAPVVLSRGVLIVTVAELVTPAGHRIEGRGVTPDGASWVSAR